MAAAGVYRRPLTGGGTAMGFDEDTVITYAGGSVTVPADQDAVLYPAGTSPVLDFDQHGYCLFIRPGSPVLWACLQEQYAAVATAIDIVPRVWSAGPDDLWLPPRHVVPPGPPPGVDTRVYGRLLLRNTDEGVTAPSGFLGNWTAPGFTPVATYALDAAPGPSNPGGAVNAFAGITRTPTAFAAGTTIPGWQLVTAPLPAMTIPASTFWQLGYFPAVNPPTNLPDLTYQGYIWIGLASASGALKATIVPVTPAGGANFCGTIFNPDHHPLNVYQGAITGAEAIAAAGDYLVLEIGFASQEPGTFLCGIYGGGAFIHVVDHEADSGVRTFLDGPFGA